MPTGRGVHNVLVPDWIARGDEFMMEKSVGQNTLTLPSIPFEWRGWPREPGQDPVGNWKQQLLGGGTRRSGKNLLHHA